MLTTLTKPRTSQWTPAPNTVSGWRTSGRAVRRYSALLLLPILVACGTARPRADQTTTTIAPTTSTTTVQQVDEIIVARWAAAYNASLAAAKDPGSSALIASLSDYFTGSALTELLQTYSAYVRAGLTSVGTIDLGSPHVVGTPSQTAIVHSCATNKLALVYAATGKPVPGSAGSSTPEPNGVISTMQMSPSGLWMVSSTTFKDGTCAGV